jgi:hypothetical protein
MMMNRENELHIMEVEEYLMDDSVTVLPLDEQAMAEARGWQREYEGNQPVRTDNARRDEAEGLKQLMRARRNTYGF